MNSLFTNKAEERRALESVTVAVTAVGVIWLMHMWQKLTNQDWFMLGVYPRNLTGIKGIFTSPFIHDNESYSHILANSGTLMLGLFTLFFFFRSVAYRSLIFIYLFTGIGVWVFGKQYVYHIGASGVVYGLISFIFFSGAFRRNVRSAILAFIMILLFSGMVAGLFPDAEGKISMSSHIAGAVSGLLVAFYFRNALEPDELQEFERNKPFPKEEEQPFLPDDTFHKTKEERRREEEDNQDYWH